MTTPYMLIILFVGYLNTQQFEDGIVCSTNTCPDSIDANPCRELADECQIQNSTYNGLMFPSPDACNCCPYCLVNIKEGQPCAMGGASEGIPESICGPGLTCQDGVCIQMFQAKTMQPCSAAQAKYDKKRQDGTVGSLERRPECDSDGYFVPYKCVLDQTCFCIDKFGNRIFGEIPYTSTANMILKCECSRKHMEILKFFDEDLHPDQYFRCTPEGDFDPIQCIGDGCFCTDYQDGAPTFPTRPDVKIKDISKDTLSECFDKKIHLTGAYYYKCADEYLNVLKEIDDYNKDGINEILEIQFPNCDINGDYAPVREYIQIDENDEEVTYYQCVNRDGTLIEPYQGTTPTTCNCARSMLLISENAPEKPECCVNGDYNKVQCRRGVCYCVDTNGYQDTENKDPKNKKVEVNMDDLESLFCYKAEDMNKCRGVNQ